MSSSDYGQYGKFTEAYDVVETVELVGVDNNRYRIDVLQCHSNSKTPFTTRTYVEEQVLIQRRFPSGPQGPIEAPRAAAIWTPLAGAPHTSREHQDEARKQAMRLLADLLEGE